MKDLITAMCFMPIICCITLLCIAIPLYSYDVIILDDISNLFSFLPLALFILIIGIIRIVKD